MPHPISKLKKRLATIPTDSKRYQLVNFFWEDSEKIEGAKACEFYWIMIPASVLGSILLGVIMALFYILIVPIAWLLGYNPTPEKKEKKEKLPSHIPKDKMLLPKGFSPRTNDYREHNPWYYIVPIVGVAGFVLVLVNGMLLDGLVGLGHFALVAWPFALGLAAVIAVLWLIGTIYKKRRFRFSAWWNKACPPLVVVQVKDDKK